MVGDSGWVVVKDLWRANLLGEEVRITGIVRVNEKHYFVAKRRVWKPEAFHMTEEHETELLMDGGPWRRLDPWSRAHG